MGSTGNCSKIEGVKDQGIIMYGLFIFWKTKPHKGARKYYVPDLKLNFIWTFNFPRML